MEETVGFLRSLLAVHGPNYFARLFGPKAKNNFLQLGGPDNVAIVLSGLAVDIEMVENAFDFRQNVTLVVLS